MAERRKVYVEVLARHEKYGKTTPVSITFEDGKTYPIERTTSRKQGAALHVPGQGIRYSITIRGKSTFLYEDRGRWFVEAKPLGDYDPKNELPVPSRI